MINTRTAVLYDGQAYMEHIHHPVDDYVKRT